jgi:hypothetical protein
MSSQENKKSQKQRKRQQKNVQRKKRAEQINRQRVRESQYPIVRIDDTYGDPRFVEAVKLAVATTRFDDSTLFGEFEQDFHKMVRDHGSDTAFALLEVAKRQLSLAGDPDARVLSHIAVLSYGTQLFEQIPEEVRKRYLPYNDVRVDFTGRDMVLRFSSMQRKSGEGGTIFYSHRRPTIRLQGREWKVAFSRHAIEQICKRVNPRYLTYAAAGDVHAFFSTCVWFEPVTLFGDQPAFAMWDMCGDPVNIRHEVYVRGVLGEENMGSGNGSFYHRVGYCPVAFEDGFAKAKTFLCPGYDTTPEYGLVKASRLPELEKDLLLHSASSSDVLHVAEEGVEAIRWFHNHGVPQVAQMQHQVFDWQLSKA